MTQNGIKLSKVGVIMLGVRDLKKSVAFYRDQLGLTRSPGVKSRAPGRETSAEPKSSLRSMTRRRPTNP